MFIRAEIIQHFKYLVPMARVAETAHWGNLLITPTVTSDAQLS
jgi:hypothetical protein